MTSCGSGVDDAALADDSGGWRWRVRMVVVTMAPGLCWDSELSGRSLVSAIVLPAIDHNQQIMGVREGGGDGGEEEGGVGGGGGGGGGGGEEEEDFNNASRRRNSEGGGDEE